MAKKQEAVFPQADSGLDLWLADTYIDSIEPVALNKLFRDCVKELGMDAAEQLQAVFDRKRPKLSGVARLAIKSAAAFDRTQKVAPRSKRSESVESVERLVGVVS